MQIHIATCRVFIEQNIWSLLIDRYPITVDCKTHLDVVHLVSSPVPTLWGFGPLCVPVCSYPSREFLEQTIWPLKVTSQP